MSPQGAGRVPAPPVDARWAWQPSYSPRVLEVSSEDLQQYIKEIHDKPPANAVLNRKH